MKISFDRIKAMNSVKNKKVIEHLYSQNPQSKYLQLDLARIRMEENELDQADQLIQSALNDFSNDYQTILKICGIYFDACRFHKALELINRFPKEKIDVPLLKLKTNILISIKAKQKEIVSGVKDILSIEPLNEFAILLLADMDIENGDYEAATEKAHDILKSNPKHVRARQTQLNSSYLCNPEQSLSTFDFDNVVRTYSLESCFTSELENLRTFNKSLVEELSSFTGWQMNPLRYPVTNGDQLDTLSSFNSSLFIKWEGLVQSKIINYLASVRPLKKDYFEFKSSEVHLLINSWAVRLRSGGYQDPHVHPTGWISGVYYVSLPELDSTKSEGGLEFGVFDSNNIFGPLHSIHPEEGMLVLFPSYLLHRTVPFTESGYRICISFDVFPDQRHYKNS